MEECIYDIQGMSCSYKQSGAVPSDIVLEIDSLKIPKGKVIFFVGPSGIGKSTILETLGFMMPREYKDPHSYRAVTLCPAGVDNIEWVGNAAFGMPAFLYTPEDYINYKCENNNNGALYIKITAIPSHSAYALLADSAFTKFEPKPQNAPGAQCRLFSRRDEGAASPICHAICERHNGTANITYADGHIDTSKNKTAILDSSYIGAYVDMSGHELIYVE